MVRYQNPVARPRPRGGKKSVLSSTAVKQVKRLISNKIEKDYYDNGLNGTGVTATGVIQTGFSTPIQGITDGQRVGDQILISKFILKYDIIYGDPTNEFRLILFRWKDDTAVGGNPTISQVLQNPVGFPVNTLINHDNVKSGKLHIMYDKTHNCTNTGQSMATTRTVNIYGRRLGNKKIIFNNGVTTGTNLIFGLWISDSIAVPNPSINWYSRLEYSDA